MGDVFDREQAPQKSKGANGWTCYWLDERGVSGLRYL
jgi:hypothetical protein